MREPFPTTGPDPFKPFDSPASAVGVDVISAGPVAGAERYRDEAVARMEEILAGMGCTR